MWNQIRFRTLSTFKTGLILIRLRIRLGLMWDLHRH